MAKGIGLIGNFKGKVGNMVGYKLTASNTGNTQGVRVYQPIVKNPKTAAQAEQRAKLAPINATYRALKMIIDRGNEGLPYGNKSRLAWLKQAFKPNYMPWFDKGVVPYYPVCCQLTKGSLASISYDVSEDTIGITSASFTTETGVGTIGAVSTALLSAFVQLKAGDQLTIVQIANVNEQMMSVVDSFVIDPTSTEATSKFSVVAGKLNYAAITGCYAGAIIISREGAQGEHMRSTEDLLITSTYVSEEPYDAASKTAAIKSYMSSAAVNADWAEESIQ